MELCYEVSGNVLRRAASVSALGWSSTEKMWAGGVALIPLIAKLQDFRMCRRRALTRVTSEALMPCPLV